ncbi:hypothetical protein LL965_21470 [Xanthomonas cassavae CFBP 4642]|uniref:X-Tfes XVIPCD domain-containing protein n=1 Tax=Xanthomonas cassavae CFBP 4642 TaxID=1219375 RepID=A0ABS8HLJ6_9XANT|nr:XVIPCD domain-containing protein [Xanthomonas cassavae]MCC4622497.1 hypothetical protein [Xanthomonas cassavae CFBP 4642]
MAATSPQLEAALARFSANPGVTQNQAKQLRTAIISDSTLLRQFEQEAKQGNLQGFSLQSSASNAPNLVGSYDIRNGVITLPTSSFQPTGTTASSDLKATLQVQQMTLAFARSTFQDSARVSHPVTQDMVDNLLSTVNRSPYLADQLKKAASTVDPMDTSNPKRAQLESFGFVGPGVFAGGTYDGNNKIMNLPPLGLQTASPNNPHGRFSAKDMAFVLGHEIQHSFNHTDKVQATAKFLNDVRSQATTKTPIHDYTNELRSYIQAGREDEAKAEIAGWNALLSHERHSNPNANGLDLMLNTNSTRTLDFIHRDPLTTKAIANPGLSFNHDGSLTSTPANIVAMGKHYFDRPSQLYAQPGQRPVSLGEHRNPAGQLQPTADYTNYYGTWAIEQILQAEDRANVLYQGARPRVTVDMVGLGLKEHLIENEGLDRGPNKTPFPYHDSSTAPPTLHHFDHTQDGSVNRAHDHRYVPIVPSTPAAGLRGPDDPEHPDHAMLEQIRSGVRKIDESVGKPYDEMSERVSRSLLAVCKDNRDAYPDSNDRSLSSGALSRVDHVVMGTTGNVFAVQGRLDDPAHQRVHVHIDEAIRTPVEQSDQKLLAANQTIAQEREFAQQQELARGINEPSKDVPIR